MNYEETLNYLYTCAPLFQQVGAHAYKPGLQTSVLLDQHFGYPHRAYPTIHIGGTNGKGSCASTIASVLQEAGYKVGLYTSPHLIDFRERIRVNGVMIPQERVVDFVENERCFFEPLHPSFFELTTALALLYFKEQEVDIAIIEVGLGGRFDCTNIISPMLSVITNISADHTQFLGRTIQEIAMEKAGIIKPSTPVVIGEYTAETRKIFQEKATEVEAPIVFAQDDACAISDVRHCEKSIIYTTREWGTFTGALSGNYQVNNTRTILTALDIISKQLHFTPQHVHRGFMQVCENTGLQGRWQILCQEPLVVADAGHNEGGWECLRQQISDTCNGSLHIVLGTSSDKDIDSILTLLPENAHYYFTKASVKRAMNEGELQEKAAQYGLNGEAYPNVASAFSAARSNAHATDLIFVGGSCFVVADFLQYWNSINDTHINNNGRR